MDETISILIRQLVSNPAVSWELRRAVINALDPDNISIIWSVSDLEGQAANAEENAGAEIGTMYDRSKFRDILETIEYNYDCNYGITWDTLDYALEEALVK